MQTKAASPSPTPSGHTTQADTWMRWVRVWHIVFYLSLVVATILTFTTGTMLYSLPFVLGLSVFQGLWYAAVMMWLVPKYQAKKWSILSLLYVIVAVAVWFPLSRASWAYYLVAASFYGLMWATLPFGLAVSGNITLTALIVWSQSLNTGRPLALSLELFLAFGMAVGWSTLLALWMRSVMRESAERKRLILQLEEAQHSLAAAERQAGILQERQRLAQEIHDTLAQGFTSIVTQLEAADQALPPDQGIVRTRLLQARETARLSLVEARRLVQALRPEPLDGASLPDAMARVAQRWKQETGTSMSFSVTGTPCPLLPEVEVSLLRLLQEGLANVSKHAQAHQVTVTLSYMDDQVALDIHDDGIGFDPQILSLPRGANQRGFGLQTMRERTQQIGGQMLIESQPGRGTTLAFQVPVEVIG